MSDSGDFMAALPSCLLPPRILFCLLCPPKGCSIKRPRHLLYSTNEINTNIEGPPTPLGYCPWQSQIQQEVRGGEVKKLGGHDHSPRGKDLQTWENRKRVRSTQARMLHKALHNHRHKQPRDLSVPHLEIQLTPQKTLDNSFCAEHLEVLFFLSLFPHGTT